MNTRLLSIPGVEADWERVYRLRALEIAGRSPALAALADLRSRHPEDYRKLLVTMKLVAGNRRVLDPKRVRRDVNGRGVLEMKGGHARLFFFYTPDNEVVICTNAYWKAKPSRTEQDAAFDRCCAMRQVYLADASR